MNLTKLILQNRHAIWSVVIGIVILGVLAYREIPVRLFPNTAPPMVQVMTGWPGATAADVEREISEVLATEFAAIENVAKIRTSSQDNLSAVSIEFHYGTNARMGAVDADNAVSRLQGELPDNADRPRVLTFSTADRPIYTIGLQADDLLAARRIAENTVKPRLQSVPGVSAVDVFGGSASAVFVDVDPMKAQAHGMSIPQITHAIHASNTSAPAGRLRTHSSETMLRVDQRATHLEDLAENILSTPDGGQIELSAVANISQAAHQDDAWFSINGERSIALQVYRAENANTVEVVEALQDAVAQLATELPQVRIVEGEESGSFTQQSVANLMSNVWQALLLASLILFFFLGRGGAALVTAFTMPLAFGLTFAVMWLLGMEFNMVTLSAVILAVGMVVDSSVVVLENIIRHREHGMTPLDAARIGTDEVQLPVLAGAGTTIVVLLPLLALPGFVGSVFAPLATTLLIAFASAVIVALILVPILSLQVRDGGRIEAVAAQITRPFQWSVHALQKMYMRLLDLGLKHRAIVLLLATAAFAVGAVALRNAGMDLLPRMDGGTFTISIETPSGTSLEQTVLALEEIEAILAQQPEVELIQSQAGFERGMTLDQSAGVLGPTQGRISVTLSPRTQRQQTIWDIQHHVRQEITKIPGIETAIVKEVGNTAKPTTVAPIVVRLTGQDLLVLDTLGNEVTQQLKTIDGVVQPNRAWHRNHERVQIHVDEHKAAAIGHSPRSVAQQLAMGDAGLIAGRWFTEHAEPEDILVRYQQDANSTMDERLAWPLFVTGTKTLDVVPIRAVASAQRVREQGMFTSENLSPVLDIFAETDGRPLNFAVADVQHALSQIELPDGYTLTVEGENKDMMESRDAILAALAMSAFAVYLLLVMQFRSWIHPITVMMAIPLSLAGVAPALWIAQKSVSMPVMVGLVLLVGIVVNNSILLVDVIRQRRNEGMNRQDAVREGVESRFRPIMMTSTSTIIGMLPLSLELALGSERFSPLATAVIGGLLASTLLTLIVIPVLYDLADAITTRTNKYTATATMVAGALAFTLAAPPSTLHAQPTMAIEDAWDLVLTHPAAQAAKQRVEAENERVQAAKRNYGPQIDLYARAGVRDRFEPEPLELPLQLPSGETPDPIRIGDSYSMMYSMGAALTQPIYTGGAINANRRAANARRDATIAHEEQSNTELWSNFIYLWYANQMATNVVLLHEDVLHAAQAREESMQRLHDAGRITDAELAVVTLKRIEAQFERSEAVSQQSTLAKALASLVGQRVQPQEIDLIDTAKKHLAHPWQGGASPQITAAQAQANAAMEKQRAVRSAMLPTIALRLSTQIANPDLTQFPIRAEWGSYWDASLIAQWTLDIGAKAKESRAAQRDAQAAQFGAQALERQVQNQRDQIQARLDHAEQRMQVAAQRVTAAQRALQTVSQANAAGRAPVVDVLEREADLARARVAQLHTAVEILTDIEDAKILQGIFGAQSLPSAQHRHQ